MESGFKLECLRRQGARSFKIDWLGNVVKVKRPQGFIKCVRVACSPWQSDSNLHATTSTQAQIEGLSPVNAILTPLALLRHVRVGDIWREGELVGTAMKATETFAQLKVDAEKMTAISARSRTRGVEPGQGFELPFTSFNGHSAHLDSYLVRIVVDKRRTLLIPCMEVVRFYFGSSGALLNKLFEGPGADKLFERLTTGNKAIGKCEVSLDKGLGGTAAPDIARIAWDEQALKAVRAIIASGIRATVNQEAYYPRLLLPFCGTTDLTALGQWIDHGSSQSFLVHQLQRCSYPFPFKELTYHMWSFEKDHSDSGESPGIAEPGLDASYKLSPVRTTTTGHKSADELRRIAFPDLKSKSIKAIWHRAKRSPVDCHANQFRV